MNAVIINVKTANAKRKNRPALKPAAKQIIDRKRGAKTKGMPSRTTEYLTR
jgi:hypothetical protein